MDQETATGLNVTPFFRKRKILTAQNLSDAVKGCDTYAAAKVLHGPMALG